MSKDVMYLDKKEREYYDTQQKRYLDETSRIREAVEKAVGEAVEQAVEKAVEEAIEKTVLNSKIGMAKTMIADNEPNARIAKYTGLTAVQIEQLRSEKM